MPRGYRLAIIAIGLTLFAYQGHSQEAGEPALESEPVAGEGQHAVAPDSNTISTNYIDPVERIVGELGGIKKAIRGLEAKIAASESAETREREDRDLQAQEDMAFWAMWMLIATLGTIAVASTGIFYVRKTLIETRHLGRAEIRAYVICKNIVLQFFDDEAEVYVTANNFGQTPAYQGKIVGRIILNDSVGGKTEVPFSGRLEVIPPNDERNEPIMISGEKIGEAAFARVRSNHVRAAIEFIIEWEDVFGSTGFSEHKSEQTRDFSIWESRGVGSLGANFNTVCIRAWYDEESLHR